VAVIVRAMVEVAAGVHRLSKGICNFYLVEDVGRLLLVDAGTPRDWAFLGETLAGMGRSPSDIEAIVLTHAHSDHTGFAERARTEAGSRVWIHEADRELAGGGKAGPRDGRTLPYLFRAETYRTFSSLARRGGLKIVPIRELSTFGDGEILDLPGDPRVIHVPGHTAGSASILFEERGVLMTGDALVTRNPLTGRLGPQVMPSGLNSNSGQALDSLSALATPAAHTVLPGHGEPWTQGAAAAVRAARSAGPS
jgi:glyoxylase-like metal-dependent hydrolase (beta-lactamase superfamily II)